MAGRLTRFLNLERRRALPGDEGETTVEQLHAQREAQLQSGVELDQLAADEQPFLRCPACEADNGRFAAQCVICLAPLTGDAVRDWNARFWAERRAQAAEDGPPPQFEGGTRDFGSALAQQVAEQQAKELRWMGVPGERLPWGLRTLRDLENPAQRAWASLATAGVFFGALATAAHAHGGLQLGAAAAAALIASVFIPRRRPRR